MRKIKPLFAIEVSRNKQTDSAESSKISENKVIVYVTWKYLLYMFLKVPHATFSAISFDEKSQRWIANSNLFFCYTCTLSCLGNEVRLTKIARVDS